MNYGYLKKGNIVSGTVNQRFRNSGRFLSTDIVSTNDTVAVSFKINDEIVKYKIPIIYSDCNYGGVRPWFQCPNFNCNKRVGKLFLRGEYFLCRHCFNLAYETKNMSEAFRLLEKAQNIRERPGAESLSTMDPFPPPKGMHYKSYFKLVRKYHYYNNASWGITAANLGISMKKV
jgi:hypothetical protein